MGKRNVATHESDKFVAKLGTVVLVNAKKMGHLV